jgi:VIT1/CCC1 family predicted Fe2+/Mn2+ transporter
METALESYKTVKDGYTQLLRSAVYKTGKERTDALNALENQNRRLQEAVQNLLKIYDSGKSKLGEFSEYSVDGLKKDLEKYKKDLSELQGGRDELSTLQSVYSTSQTSLITDRYTYFAYIIAVLVLLIVDFIMFVVLSFSGSSSSSSSDVSSVTAGFPMPG